MNTFIYTYAFNDCSDSFVASTCFVSLRMLSHFLGKSFSSFSNLQMFYVMTPVKQKFIWVAKRKRTQDRIYLIIWHNTEDRTIRGRDSNIFSNAVTVGNLRERFGTSSFIKEKKRKGKNMLIGQQNSKLNGHGYKSSAFHNVWNLSTL